jgi:hypothetical protein
VARLITSATAEFVGNSQAVQTIGVYRGPANVGVCALDLTVNATCRWSLFGATGQYDVAPGTHTVELKFYQGVGEDTVQALIDGVVRASATHGVSDQFNKLYVMLARTINSSGASRANATSVVVSGTTTTWPWDDVAELVGWTQNGDAALEVSGGQLLLPSQTPQVYIGSIIRTYAEATPTLSATLQAPGILRRAMATGGSISTDYELGADTAILSGTADKHPEILALNASSAALAMVFQRDEQGESNVYYSTGGGAEAAGAWGTVQQVRAARAYPCACVLKPTHDAYVIAYNSADISSYGQRLAWNGSSYDIGSEVTVVNGTAAAERGAVAWDAGKGRLHFTYADTDGAVQILTSDDCGATWA